MVLLVETLGLSLKFPSKLDNHHHQNSEALSASIQAFRCDISKSFNQLLLNSKPGSEFMSLEWMQQFFKLLPWMNKAFEKLVVDIDYPVSKWQAASAEEYLKYSLNLLELLNSVNFCLSHLSQNRLMLLHAMNMIKNSPSVATKKLKKIQPIDPGKHFKVENLKESEERHLSDKELVIHQALLAMKSIGSWVFGIITSGLCSDVKPYSEMRKLATKFDDSLLKIMDSRVGKDMKEKHGVLKEVKEVNDAADSLLAAIGTSKGNRAAKELRMTLQMLEKLLQGIEKETDHLFAEILADRNKLLDSLRITTRSNTD